MDATSSKSCHVELPNGNQNPVKSVRSTQLKVLMQEYRPYKFGFILKFLVDFGKSQVERCILWKRRPLKAEKRISGQQLQHEKQEKQEQRNEKLLECGKHEC